MRVTKTLKPLYVATDYSKGEMPANAAFFIKNMRSTWNANDSHSHGGSAGGNEGSFTPLQSALDVLRTVLPTGYNRNIGAFEFENEFYFFNYNDGGNHGIYMADADTLSVQHLLIDEQLGFSLLPEHAIAEHRVNITVVYATNADDERVVKEKYLKFTDGNNWQRWINVIAAIKTNGFDASLFPYWKLQPPHFDRRELFEYAVRAALPAPVVREVPLLPADRRKVNKLLNRSTQFAYTIVYTDGRKGTLSQWSAPYQPKVVSGQGYSANQPRCLEIELYAGGASVERIEIYRKFCKSDWVRYDTINKFPSCEENDPAKIGDEYWRRVKAWNGYSYDPVKNTIRYTYCGDKECAVVSQDDALRFQSDLPLRSIATTPAGDSILFGNNEYTYDNFDCEVMKKFSLKLREPQQGGCTVKMVKIRVYSMYLRAGAVPQVMWKEGGDTTIRFGGTNYPAVLFPGFNDFSVDKGENDRFELFFKNGGPVAYLAGTRYFSVGKQYRFDRANALTEIGALDMTQQDDKTMAIETFRNGGGFVYVHEFSVPAGKYIVRMAGHNTSVTENYEKTSTYVLGVGDSRSRIFSGYYSQSSVRDLRKEMAIDACNGDVDVWGNQLDTFLCFVPYIYEGGFLNLNRRWRFVEGYMYENEADKIPVEMQSYKANHGSDDYNRGGWITDHNGFFFQYAAKGGAKDMKVQFHAKRNCAIGGWNNPYMRSNDLPDNERGFFKDNVFVDRAFNGVFGDCNRVIVRGYVRDQDGNGIDGAAVTITRGSTAYTASDGSYELIVHVENVERRMDELAVNAPGTGVITGPNCTCIQWPTYDESLVPCLACNERVYPLSVDFSVRVLSLSGKGLKGGGRYGVALIGLDLAGRATYANLIDYIDIPTIIERGYYQSPSIEVVVSGPLNLPADISYIAFVRTRNLNNESYIQWIGDKIEYLDNRGEVIGSPGGAIRARISIQSLLDYNIENNFSTTTRYQFVRGDFIRFYDDGDGSFFQPDQKGFLDLQILGTNWDAANQAANTQLVNDTADNAKSLEDGASLIVPYDSRLATLKKKCGFWIEINRPNECQDREKYCEIAGLYPVIGGNVQFASVVLDTWDTYFQDRFIVNTECSGKAIVHPFESSSVTDYWGEDCNSCGRETIRDEYAKRRWYGDDVIKSDDLVNEGRVNGLGTFREKNRKAFKGQSWGGIVAMRAERKIILFICENDWFTTDFEYNVVRVTSSGLAVATLDNAMGDTNQKVGDNYGCEMENTASVIFENGFCFYASAKRGAVILNDFRSAVDISLVDNKSYFSEKFKFVQQFNDCAENRTDHFFDTVFGFDPLHEELHVSFRPRRNRGVAPHTFANAEREIKIPHQETFVYSLPQKKWVRFAGFVPEMYGRFRKSKSGVEMVCFAAGVPFFMNSRTNKSFNNFFGIQTERVFESVVNDAERMILQNWFVDDPKTAWFVDRISTPESNAFSYLPLSYMKKEENGWYAEFLRDMNSFAYDKEPFRRMLIDGKRVFGSFIVIRAVADPRTKDGYSELKEVRVEVAVSNPQVNGDKK